VERLFDQFLSVFDITEYLLIENKETTVYPYVCLGQVGDVVDY
jgi:hypothetical protein